MKTTSGALRAMLFGAGLLLGAQGVLANETVDAAIGGAVGGAIGGAVGQELGGREGAIIGAAAGAGIGAAVTTDSDDSDRRSEGSTIIVTDGPGHPHGGRFCPPGQAKKGNC